MPIATPEVYNEMLDRAKAGKFAYPAINVTSSQTLHAALRGFAEAESDGIVQISTGGAEFLGGQHSKDMVTGAVALAEFAHIVAEKYDVTVALHTDHCPKDKLDGYVRPLLAVSEERVKAGRNPLFQSHMWTAPPRPCPTTSPSPRNCWSAPAPPGSSSRSRSPRPAARRTASPRDQRLPLHDGRRRDPHRRGPRPGREGPLPARRLLRQRARRVQAGQRRAPPRAAQGAERGHRREVRAAGRQQAVRLRLPRRLRLHRRGDRDRPGERRGQDEHRHGHPVRLHASGRRPHVPQLRRRPEGRRRGRQQEDLRPAHLGKLAEAGMAARVVEACGHLRSAGQKIK